MLGRGKPAGKGEELFKLGLTGGIASGKSTVAAMFAELGAQWIDFDQLAREVVKPGRPAFQEIVDLFGDRVVTNTGCLDRQLLADLVFQDPEKKRQLEAVTHPRIFEQYQRLLHKVAAKKTDTVVLADVPLLVELDLKHLFHKTLLVFVPETLQIERLAKRNRISRDKAAGLLKTQMPLAQKRRYTDYLIDNSGGFDTTRARVLELWKMIRKQGQGTC